MAELTAQRLRELDGNELYAALDNGPDRPLVQAEIRRRELAGLPEAVADALRLLAYTEATLGSRPERVRFSVTTDYDDGPAWDHHAEVRLACGRVVEVDFYRTTVADSLVELSEHAEQPLARGDVVMVDLVAASAEMCEQPF